MIARYPPGKAAPFMHSNTARIDSTPRDTIGAAGRQPTNSARERSLIASAASERSDRNGSSTEEIRTVVTLHILSRSLPSSGRLARAASVVRPGDGAVLDWAGCAARVVVWFSEHGAPLP